ncbi:thermonuclease family protein [Ancylobacter sonchi]|nr:thermonuclease family protein [Ancylobacter sonchi]
MPTDGSVSQRPMNRRFRRRGGGLVCLVSACLVLTGLSARAGECPTDFDTTVAARGLDGHGDIALADGRTLRLAALADIGTAADPARRAALKALVAGRRLDLASADSTPDRYGRLAALARLPDGRLVQEAMLAEGLAVARPEAGYLGCMPGLLAAERPARAARLGVWAQWPLKAEPPAALAQAAGHFSVVTGRVRTVGSTRRVDYLNFGPVWRQDTTVKVDSSVRPALAARGLAPAGLAGREITLRGTVDLVDGPVIDLRWAEQVDEVAEASGP